MHLRHLFLLVTTTLQFVSFSSGRQFRVTDQVFLDIENEEKPLGRVVIGLFGDLAPRAVENFKVLATKGIQGKSYKGTSFNRVIKRFMIQGGDVVSDNGSGSISIYGENFDDENLDTAHSMAGFVSMANKGKNTNGCQFLITLKGTPWLDGLHTVVGKVVQGQSVVHLVEHTPIDAEDRPTLRVFVADCGLVPTPQPFYISDDPYEYVKSVNPHLASVVDDDLNPAHFGRRRKSTKGEVGAVMILFAWLKACGVPLTMSLCILGFFHWMIKKMEI